VLAGCLVGVLLAEGVARTRNLDPNAPLLFGAPAAVPPALFSWDEQLGMVPSPGFQTRLETVDYAVDVRIDSHGLRGAEPGDGPHWLVLGDSFAMALQVPEEQTFEGLLAEQAGASVLNGGVDSFSGWHEALRYEHLAESLDIDQVIMLVFLGNDVVDNVQFLDERGGDPDGALRTSRPTFTQGAIGVSALPGWEHFLFKHSVLYANLRVAKARAAVETGQSPEMAQSRDENRLFLESNDAWASAEILAAPVRRLHQATTAHGARLLVAVAPPFFVMDPSLARDRMELYGQQGAPLALDALSEAVVARLRAEGVTTCDLTPPLRASWQAGADPYLRFDGHWSRIGHQVTADAIAACLDGA